MALHASEEDRSLDDKEEQADLSQDPDAQAQSEPQPTTHLAPASQSAGYGGSDVPKRQ